MMHNGGQDLGWILVFVTIWLVVIAGAVAVGWRLIRQRAPQPRSLPSPLDILERRFAAGELGQDEFDEARARLREHEIDL